MNVTTVLSFTKFASFVLIASTVIFSFKVNAEDLYSLSSELLKQVGDDAFWEAKVKCEGDFRAVVIRQKLKQDDWCLVGGQLSCKKTKLKMAEEVCLNIAALVQSRPKPVRPVVTAAKVQPSSSTAQLNNAEAEKASQRLRLARIKAEQDAKENRERDRLALASALNEEQLVLQEERIILNQEKLEVEQIELRLDSRAREIKQQLLSLEN